ncbi:hypothetical protein SprV_0100058900 [Sparganum proliferum]
MFGYLSRPPETKIAWENCESDEKGIDSRLLENHPSANPSKTMTERLTRSLYKLHFSTKDTVSTRGNLEVPAGPQRATDTGKQNASSALSSISSLPCVSGASSLWGKEVLGEEYHEHGGFLHSAVQRDVLQRGTDDHPSNANKNNRQNGTLELLAQATAQLKELRLSVSAHQPSARETVQPPAVGTHVAESWKENSITSPRTNDLHRHFRVPFERDFERTANANDQSEHSAQEKPPEPLKRAARGRFRLGPQRQAPQPQQRSAIRTGQQIARPSSHSMRNEESTLTPKNRPSVGNKGESRGQSMPRTFRSQTFLHFSTLHNRSNEDKVVKPRSLSESSRPVAFQPIVVARKRPERPEKPIRRSVNIFETPLSQNQRKHTVLACLHAETPDANQSMLATKPKFRRRFFLPETAQIEEMLFDSHDRRLKAICSRYLCDLKVYSKMLHGGCLRNVIVLSACHMESLRKCTRALDSRMNWCLTAQLK